ncbi:interferon-induced protein 44-like isoform X1 [Saccostrea echinata]|uniref:interferon-induced protein 44-like isoform X1 n=1 Tax=Saccostrea echinata TaxID=191078 RepID=UPI002A81C589|nr:interferon-induced protein 44-like isoform X1 [Saccostrea echinata]
MGGLLKHKDRIQLSEWIGRACNFALLYKVSRDGGSAKKFHELCDNKGPTVTVFYNKDNNVYGGYLSETWGVTCTNSWCTDQNAFLFKLYTIGEWKPKKFLSTGKSENHYKSNNHGPWFANLNSIFNSVDKSYDYYKMHNSNYFTGSHFHMGGESSLSIANGHNDVTDMEVYLVIDGPICAISEIPWREKPQWNLQTFQELKEFITKYEPFEESEVPEANILLIGQVGAGKSSFLNTINSIFKGVISSRACTGSAENSLTKSFEKIRIRDPAAKKHLKFRICDTRGIEKALSIKEEDLRYILDGNLPNHYIFNPVDSASAKVQGFVKDPTLKERMHVVVFVIDGSTLDVLPEDIIKKLKDFKTLIVDKGIPQLVFLTKMDKVCGFVEKDISNMFMSEVVEGLVNKAADVIGIPRSHVFPVKNYEKETNLHINLNILVLGALRQALLFADDFLENQSEIEQENSRR